jgi:hypothetical protein
LQSVGERASRFQLRFGPRAVPRGNASGKRGMRRVLDRPEAVSHYAAGAGKAIPAVARA